MVLIGGSGAAAYVLTGWLASELVPEFSWRILWLIGAPTGLLLILYGILRSATSGFAGSPPGWPQSHPARRVRGGYRPAEDAHRDGVGRSYAARLYLGNNRGERGSPRVSFRNASHRAGLASLRRCPRFDWHFITVTATRNPSRTEGAHPSGKCDGGAANKFTEDRSQISIRSLDGRSTHRIICGMSLGAGGPYSGRLRAWRGAGARNHRLAGRRGALSQQALSPQQQALGARHRVDWMEREVPPPQSAAQPPLKAANTETAAPRLNARRLPHRGANVVDLALVIAFSCAIGIAFPVNFVIATDVM
jgi:hypothetical protein